MQHLLSFLKVHTEQKHLSQSSWTYFDFNGETCTMSVIKGSWNHPNLLGFYIYNKKNTMLFWIPQNPVDSGHFYWQSIIWKTLIFWHTQHTYQTCSLLCGVNYPTSENINLYSKPNQFTAYEFQGKNCYLVTPPTYSCVIMDREKVHQYRVLTEHYFFSRFIWGRERAGTWTWVGRKTEGENPKRTPC